MRRTKVIDDVALADLGYYSNENMLQRRIKTVFEVSLLVFIWYFTAVITITSSKEIMNRLSLPFILCTIQFIFASSLSYIYLQYSQQLKSQSYLINQSYNSGSNNSFGSLVSLLYQISFSYTLGFILTNWAFSLGKITTFI